MIDNKKFNSYQMVIFLLASMLGVGLLQLPSILTEQVGNEGYIMPLISGVISIVSVFFICYAGSIYGDRGLVDTSRFIYGKVLGIILIIPLWMIFFIACSVESRLFVITIKLFLLDTTPIPAILLPFFLVLLFLLRGEFRHIGRFAEFVLPFVLFIVALLFILVIPGCDFTDLLPLGQRTFTEYFKAIDGSVFSYLGVISLLVIYPYFKKTDLKSTFKTSAIAVGSISLIYSVTVGLCISKLGTAETKWLLYPTISLIKSAYIPGGFIERLEGLLMAIWVILVFMTMAIAIYSMANIVLETFKFRDRRFIVTAIIPFIYISATSALSLLEVMDVSLISGYILGTYSMFILPVLIGVGYRIKMKKRRGKGEV
ncbi:MAG: GerAB/ArcD/ProY family transporter [Clostridium sp.]